MKGVLTACICLILCAGVLSAQEKCILSGVVTDAATRYPIPGVNILIKESRMGMCTNSDGYYVLTDIPAGTIVLVVTALGFTPEEMEIILAPGESRTFDMILREAAYQLNPITVTATRERSLVSEVPASVEIVSMRDIARRNLQNIAQAVELLPGVFAKDYGGIGDQKSLSIRGSTSGQILVLIDGQKLNTAQTGDVDLSAISMESVERIEVVKGGSSALYGSDAVGGVINIITKSRPQVNSAGISGKVLAGSFGTKSGEGSATISGQHLYALLNYKYLASDGNFEYSSPYGGRIERVNADVESHSLFAKGSYRFGRDSLNRILAVSTQLYSSVGGSPGTSLQPSSDARKKNRNASYNASYEQRIGSLFNSIRLQSYVHDLKSWYDSPSSLVPIHSTHRSVAWGAELQGRVVLNASNVLIGGYAYRRDDLTSTNTEGNPYRQTNSLYLQDEFEPFFGQPLLWFKRAIIIPAARWDSFSDFGGRVSPKVGLVLSMGDEWQASIKGNYGWSFRAPSFNDLYWPQDPWTRGNPNLRPESGKDFDIGAMLRHPFWWGLSADAAYFQNNVTDLISWQPGSSGLWMPGNVGMAKIQGMEAKIALTPWNSFLRIEWNYTNVLAVNETDAPNERGKILPYRPRHTHNVSIEADYAGVSMRATTTYVTKRYTSIANTTALPSYTTADASIGWRYSVYGVPIHIQCEGKNLFDLEYQIMDGFPMPPREFRLTLGMDASGIITLSSEDSESSNPRSR